MPLVRVSITLPPELVSQADREASRRGLSRSGLLAEALEQHLLSVERETLGGRVAEPAAGAYIARLPNESLLEELGRRLGVEARDARPAALR